MTAVRGELGEAKAQIETLEIENASLKTDLADAKEQVELGKMDPKHDDEQTKIISTLSEEKRQLREERDALDVNMNLASQTIKGMEKEVEELKVALEKAKQASQVHIKADEVNGKVELALQKMSDVCRLGHMQPSLNDGVSEMEMRLEEFKSRFGNFQDALAARAPLP